MKIAKYFLVLGLYIAQVFPHDLENLKNDVLMSEKICVEAGESDLGFDYKNLIDEAVRARENSFSPYSKFKVGAAVLSKSGKIYTGTNVENASYGLTICAERVAIFKAVCGGEKGNFIKAIAIVLEASEYGAPCGACRQVINEFANPGAYIVMGTVSGKYKIEQLKTLLPYAFKLAANND